MRRSTFLRLLALACPLVALHPAGAASLDTVYAVTVRGLPVGSAELKGEFAEGRYSLRISGGIRGLARFFSDAKTTASSSGMVEEGRLDPADYSHVWVEDGEKETVGLHFSGRRLADVSLDPPRKRPERYVPLSDADREDVIDPVTAFVWRVAGVTPDICGRSLPLMDGKRRFDLDLSYSRTESFSTRDRSFSGRAVVCKASYRRIAGHRVDKKKDESITGDSTMEIWMAPVGDGLAVPARIQFASRMGRVVLTATKIKTR
jgi:hypothetical protein